MDPIMISLGPLALRWYGVLIALGVVLGTLWALRICRRRGLDGEWLLDTAPWLVFSGILGARLVYVLTSPQAFFGPGGNPLRAFYVWEGGISIHGAVIAIVIVFAWRARLKKADVWAYLDAVSPVAALGIIGGRIGNFMNGSDTGGRLTDLAIGFSWPQPGTPTFGEFGRLVFGEPLWLYAPPVCRSLPFGDPCVVHLTPLYGGLVGVILIGLIAYLVPRAKVSGSVFLQVVIWYSILRSVIEEPFRDNPLLPRLFEDASAGIGLFTLTQVASVPIVIYALFLLRRRARRAA
jgi:phosphatidylglycerol---prolipoprotein diacylglyceryl transferase